jgi:hypothetical protein
VIGFGYREKKVRKNLYKLSRYKSKSERARA